MKRAGPPNARWPLQETSGHGGAWPLRRGWRASRSTSQASSPRPSQFWWSNRPSKRQAQRLGFVRFALDLPVALSHRVADGAGRRLAGPTHTLRRVPRGTPHGSIDLTLELLDLAPGLVLRSRHFLLPPPLVPPVVLSRILTPVAVASRMSAACRRDL